MKRHAFLALSGISTLVFLAILFALVLRDAQPQASLPGVSPVNAGPAWLNHWLTYLPSIRSIPDDQRTGREQGTAALIPFPHQARGNAAWLDVPGINSAFPQTVMDPETLGSSLTRSACPVPKA